MDARAWLRAEYAKRRARNPRFSHRAFARLLSISPGRFSEILSGERAIGTKLAERIGQRLRLTPYDYAQWMETVRVDAGERGLLQALRRYALAAGPEAGLRVQYAEVSESGDLLIQRILDQAQSQLDEVARKYPGERRRLLLIGKL